MAVVNAAELRARLVQSFPSWAGDEILLEPLGGGMTNHNVLVRCSSMAPRSFVARLPGESTELLGVDRANECAMTRRAADLGVAPPMLGELSGIGTPVIEYVAGRHLEGADFAARLDEVAVLVSRLHGSGPLARAFPIHRVVEWHARDAVGHGVSLPDAFGALYELSGRIEAAFAATPEPPVPCHNDLLPGNVVFGGSPERAWLLDYEYAGMNDRYFDLGNLAVNSDFDEAADVALLQAYFGCVTARHRARLSLMRVMSDVREAMWGVVQQAISTLDTDFVAYAADRFDNARAQLAALDVDATLDAAAAR